MSYEARAAEPCIGEERADLVVCGCAILEALLAEWPSERIRVADRGLREGILVGLANDRNRERTRRRRRRKRAPAEA
jgi:exopolyphosphatase/guanosine-5'-triphosphate,3'-diphosphate pyrophosphatase